MTDPNPYAAPQYPAATAELTYYQPLSTRLNVREYRRMSNGWGELLVAVFLKFLRIRIPMSFAFADSRHFQRIAPQDLSPRGREQIKPLADQALDLNLKYAFSYWMPVVGTIEGAAAAFISDDARSFLLIVYAKTWTKSLVNEKVVFAFATRLANGKTVATSSAKGDLDSPPHVLGESHPGKTMAEIYERHQARLNDAAAEIVQIDGPDGLERLLRVHEHEVFAFNLNRGVYVPISERELARLQQLEVVTPETPRARARQRFQGIELICWIALVAVMFLFTQDQPTSGSQLVVRVGMLLAALSGIAIVWLIRGVLWMRDSAHDEPPIGKRE